jgi:DNA-binding transcriptional LysR family regulator
MVNLVSISQALLVAEHLSFSRAARVLGVRQSAVSRRVRELEDKLGVSLFERDASGVRVTEAGRRFLGRSGAALAEIDYAVKAAANAGRGAEGAIRIGILSSLSNGFVRELLARYREVYPAVAIDLVEGPACEHIARISGRLLDIAFVFGTPAAPRCDTVLVWEARVFVVLSECHRLAADEIVSPEALLGEQFVVSRETPGPEIHDDMIRRLAAMGHSISVERYGVGRETLMHMVALGFGISLISEAGIATRYPGVVFRALAPAEDVLPYFAVWLPGNDNPALRRFLSLARSMSQVRAIPVVPAVAS